jgi:hypothetical protein
LAFKTHEIIDHIIYYLRNAAVKIESIDVAETIKTTKALIETEASEVARTQDVWGAEGISGRVKFLPLAWAGMPKTSFRKNSDSPLLYYPFYDSDPCRMAFYFVSGQRRP